MVRIVSDTSTMYSTTEAKAAGFEVSPLAVTIAGESYRELDEMTAERFVKTIREGHMPASSQPAIGEVMALYESHPGEEILNIAMADGLSGTYQSAMAAAHTMEGGARITVLNSRMLCGPHRRMVEVAADMAAKGEKLEAIVSKMEAMMDSAKSFLLPVDFDYLCRGGRLSPLVSFVGKTIRLVPVLTQTEDGRQLTMYGVKRSFRQAVEHVSRALKDSGVGAGWRVYVTHAAAPEQAHAAAEQLRALFADAQYEVHQLTPAFITQGGPGCVAIQIVKD